MLTHLYIKNYALIDEFSVDFQQGFNIMAQGNCGKVILDWQ